MSVLYFELDANMQSCSTIKDKIKKIDAIIDALLTTALKSVANGHRVEYLVDDGQSKQKVTYSSTSSITKAIQEYETVRQSYVNMIVGQEFRNVDQRNLRRNGC